MYPISEAGNFHVANISAVMPLQQLERTLPATQLRILHARRLRRLQLGFKPYNAGGKRASRLKK